MASNSSETTISLSALGTILLLVALVAIGVSFFMMLDGLVKHASETLNSAAATCNMNGGKIYPYGLFEASPQGYVRCIFGENETVQIRLFKVV